MGNAKYIGRTGALAAALGVVITAVVQTSAVSPDMKLAANSTVLTVCGATCPQWHDTDVDRIMNQFVTPTHPGHTMTPVAVRTRGEAGPITGLLRLIGFAVGDPSFFGPGGAAWPDEPWWKLTGLFDLTTDQSIRAGVVALEQEMAAHGGGNLVIYGYSQGGVVANQVKRRLAEQYPAGTAAPDIDFVLGGSANVPNGGLHARFPGFHIPILDWTFDGPAPTDTQFHTDVITRQYDGLADFPLYPLNIIADLNALLGFLYVHTYPFEVSLPADPSTSPAYQGTHGDTSYYFFETQDLPLFAPLRMLGVPEQVIDIVEPFFRVIVELGYDRTIPPWEPTPARLIPTYDPAEVFADLTGAISEGVDNALALVGLPALAGSSAPAPSVAADIETAKAASADERTPDDTPTPVEQVSAADTDARQSRTENVVPADTEETAADTAASDASDEDSDNGASTPKPRSVVRESLGADQRLPDRFNRDEDDEPTESRDGHDVAGAADDSASTPASSASSTDSSSDSDGASDGDSADS